MLLSIPKGSNDGGNILRSLGKPKIANVRCVDADGKVQGRFGQTATARAPTYAVEAVCWLDRPLRCPFVYDDPDITLIGFGERFVTNRTRDWISPWGYEAPEVIFDHCITSKADIWSLGCLVVFSIHKSWENMLMRPIDLPASSWNIPLYSRLRHNIRPCWRMDCDIWSFARGMESSISLIGR